MRHCLECGIDITNRGNRAGLCFSCQKEYRDGYQKEYQPDYQKEYHKFKPKSARATSGYWQFWKMLNGLTRSELNFLFYKKRNECINAPNDDIKRLRTEMVIINEQYKKAGHRAVS